MRKFLSILLTLFSVVMLQAQPTGSEDCSADFTATVDGFVISLNGTASIEDSTDYVTSWFWEAGQDMALTGQNTTFTPAFGVGVYNICLLVTTNNGCFTLSCQDVIINDDGSGGTDSTSCYIWASFFATTSGTTASFTDFSSAGNTMDGITSWSWDFGDGNMATDQNPTNEYAEEGSYVVCLTVTDAEGCEDTNCQDVVVGDVAIGDCETIANGSSPYAASDSIFMEVIAADSYCCTGVWDGICQGLYDEIAGGGNGGTDSLNCEAYFYHTADTTGNGGGIPINSGLTVTFWDASEGGGEWTWDFGNGETASGPQQTYTYEEEGTYTVCLTIINATGCTSTYCEDIVVSEWVGESCLASFGFYSSQDSSAFSFDFIDWSSTDVVSWDWDLGDGNFSSEQNPSHTYSDYGEYYVCLTVTTEDGCSSVLCQAITIWNPANCEAHFWHSALPGDSAVLDTVVIIDPSFGGLTVTFLDCSLGNPDTWTWDFGNGETASGPQQTYTYSEAGTYTVCLTITNEAGCESMTCQDILVEESEWGQCYAEFSFYPTDSTSTNTSNTFQFEDWSSDNVAAWEWDFGDGNTSTEQNPIHTYEDGIYTACLTVVTADGCVSNMCANIIAGDGDWQPTGLSICGSVNVANSFNTPTTYDATVYLIEYDAENNTLTAVDSTIAIGFGWGQDDSSSFSFYCFDGLEEGGEYLVKAAMNEWSPLY
ncbi:MAG: PKD domain-containing protein, partial [Chitinophagales bacterium]